MNQAFCETMKWKISPGSQEVLFSLPSLCRSCPFFFFFHFFSWEGNKTYGYLMVLETESAAKKKKKKKISEHFTWFCCLVDNLLRSLLFFTKTSFLIHKTNFSTCTINTNCSCFLVMLNGKVFKAWHTEEFIQIQHHCIYKFLAGANSEMGIWCALRLLTKGDPPFSLDCGCYAGGCCRQAHISSSVPSCFKKWRLTAGMG